MPKTSRTSKVQTLYTGQKNVDVSTLINNIGNQNVSRIIMIADNPEINGYLEYINSQNFKSLFMLTKGSNSDIEVDIKYVNIDYPIAYALGLNDNEI